MDEITIAILKRLNQGSDSPKGLVRYLKAHSLETNLEAVDATLLKLNVDGLVAPFGGGVGYVILREGMKVLEDLT